MYSGDGGKVRKALFRQHNIGYRLDQQLGSLGLTGRAFHSAPRGPILIVTQASSQYGYWDPKSRK